MLYLSIKFYCICKFWYCFHYDNRFYLFPVYRLETQLIKIQAISYKWNAVLLLDEADIYLEARNTSDLNRNAMTGVFLRQLEYHQGKNSHLLFSCYYLEFSLIFHSTFCHYFPFF